jgi:hypothetical protein
MTHRESSLSSQHDASKSRRAAEFPTMRRIGSFDSRMRDRGSLNEQFCATSISKRHKSDAHHSPQQQPMQQQHQQQQSAPFGANANYFAATADDMTRCTSDPAMRRPLRRASGRGVFRSDPDLPAAARVSLRGGYSSAVMPMVQRSNSKAVKAALEHIQQVCQSQQDGSTTSSFPPSPPQAHLRMLAQWATDEYYKVVICKYNGISTIVQAMLFFPLEQNIQADGSTALGLLVQGNASLQDGNGAAGAVAAATRNHPASISVQSAARTALRQMALGMAVDKVEEQSVQSQSNLQQHTH